MAVLYQIFKFSDLKKIIFFVLYGVLQMDFDAKFLFHFLLFSLYFAFQC